MVRRTRWISAIEGLWREKSIVWLSGVRRAGKFAVGEGIAEAPPFYGATEVPERGFQDWIDSFWARDIQEHFRLQRRWSFLRFVELLFAASGGMFEATAYAARCEVSRTTVAKYLQVLEDTFVLHVVRPYSTQRRRISYWRDKRGHEVDFVIAGRKEPPAAVECKWSADQFDVRGLRAFRTQYPAGANYVVTADTERSYVRDYRGLSVRFVSLPDLFRYAA